MADVPLISIRNLKTYFYPDEGIVKAVDGASFDIPRGRTIGIVGESGCGKSVTARPLPRTVERPGRSVEGRTLFQPDASGTEATAIDRVDLPADGKRMRDIRGGEIA